VTGYTMEIGIELPARNKIIFTRRSQLGYTKALI